MCIGWFFKEEFAPWLPSLAAVKAKAAPQGSWAQWEAGGGCGLPKGPLHNTWAGWAGQVPMAEWIHSDLASPNWVCALGPGSTRYVVRYSCRTAQVGLSGTSPVKKREPLLEAELSGGSLHGDSFQHFPYCSSCPLAGPTHSQRPTEAACLGPWLLGLHRGIFSLLARSCLLSC